MTSKIHVQTHPTIGGKVTCFVLCYGDFPDLARRCLSNILQTVPITALDIRVGANCVSGETLEYLKNLPITKLYVNEGSCYKYPMMRKMFYDESCPINTKYLMWFDDDTYVANEKWFVDLCSCIIQKHPENYRMFGSLYYHDTARYPAAKPWFSSGDWHTGKDFRLKHKSDDEGGSIIDFGVGWFWALETEAMRKANIPDTRLQHNGGDITIGEQLHQHGYKVYNWNPNKQYIACPTRAQGGRRGFSQAFPWDTSHGS
jgi:GT2 family glycosyltransferase